MITQIKLLHIQMTLFGVQGLGFRARPLFWNVMKSQFIASRSAMISDRLLVLSHAFSVHLEGTKQTASGPFLRSMGSS